MTYLLCAGESLLGSNLEFNSESLRHRTRFSHYLSRQIVGVRTFDDFSEGRSTQSAYRIKRNVSHQLNPHFMPDIAADGSSESGADERISDSTTTIAF